jgi:hypothetical protein
MRFLPKDIRHKIPSSENLIHDYLKIMPLGVVDGNPDAAVLGKKFPKEFQARVHHGEPCGVLQIVVVMLEGAFRVVGGIDVDALDAPGIVGDERFQGVQVVPLDQYVLQGQVAGGHLRYLLQQAIGRLPGQQQVGFAGQPV